MIDLKSMNLDDLLELKFEVEAAIHTAKAELKALARKEIEAIAAEHGIPLNELLGTRKGKPGNGQKNPPGVPKYRNPFNPAQTWTGKGTRPGWFVAAQAGGMAPESKLI